MGVLVSSYCSSYGAENPFISLGTFSNSFIVEPILHPMDSSEAMPVPDKYRSGCSQPSIGLSTGSPMKELEKEPMELKRFAAPWNNNMN